jgi:hypothetical protein
MKVLLPAWDGADEVAWEQAGCANCAEMARHVARLERDNERLRQRVTELEQAVEQAQRAGKRQAAPFSKGAADGNGDPGGGLVRPTASRSGGSCQGRLTATSMCRCPAPARGAVAR